MIPFLDIKKINLAHQNEIEEAIIKTFRSGWYIHGKEVSEFESRLAHYVGADFCVGVSNGLDALRLILKGYIELGRLKKGDEVIVPANTFIATVLAVTDSGLIPILAEPSEDSFNITVSSIEAVMTPKVRAMILVHLYGRVAINNEIKELANSNNIILIEDNAQAIGAEMDGKKTGNLGDAAAFSFYPGKNLGAIGDGGAITSNDSSLSMVIRKLSNYGSEKKYIHELQGYNHRLDEIQAAVLNIKLKYIEQENEIRRRIAERFYIEVNNPLIKTPNMPKYRLEHVWHLYVVQCSFRQELQNHLKKEGISTMIHYPTPVYDQPAYRSLKKPKFQGFLHQKILSIPNYFTLSNDDISIIINALNSFNIS